MDQGIQEADPNTFEILDLLYARDANHIFSRGEMIPVANPTSFEVLTHGYAKDGEWVYNNNYYGKGHVIEGADMDSFEVLDAYYAKDAHHLYWMKNLLSTGTLDLNTVELVSPKVVRDAKGLVCTIDTTSIPSVDCVQE